MALYRCQITLAMDTGLGEDATTNTMYFDSDTEAALADVFDEISTMYSTFGTVLSSLVDTGTSSIKAYRLSDPEPRIPVRQSGLGVFTTSSAAGPTEVACVLSYEGARVSGLPQARRRGRMFIGPIGPTSTDRPSSGLIAQVLSGAQGLLDASDLATDWTWAQYSPTNGVGIDVTNGWVDNEWDTQRRRGRKATLRSTFS